MQCCTPETDIVRITDTLQYTSKSFALPKTTTEDYLRQAIGDILVIIQDPPKIIPFLSYGAATENAINKIAHILQQSKAQPRLPILPLPPILPQVQNKILLSTVITHPDTPAPRVEPVVKNTRVQPSKPVNIAHLRVKHEPSPTIDPSLNPWI